MKILIDSCDFDTPFDFGDFLLKPLDLLIVILFESVDLTSILLN